MRLLVRPLISLVCGHVKKKKKKFQISTNNMEGYTITTLPRNWENKIQQKKTKRKKAYQKMKRKRNNK
jgi:hypothetical protein